MQIKDLEAFQDVPFLCWVKDEEWRYLWGNRAICDLAGEDVAGKKDADLIWKAMAPVLSDRLTAGHFLSVCGTVVAGPHPDTGELFLLVEPQAGGWGAGADKDGENGNDVDEGFVQAQYVF